LDLALSPSVFANIFIQLYSSQIIATITFFFSRQSA
jgi:hypothetical protein